MNEKDEFYAGDGLYWVEEESDKDADVQRGRRSNEKEKAYECDFCGKKPSTWCLPALSILCCGFWSYFFCEGCLKDRSAYELICLIRKDFNEAIGELYPKEKTEKKLLVGRWHRVKDSEMLPRFAGNYIIFYDGAVQYVGKAKNVKARLVSHGIYRSWVDREKIKVAVRKEKYEGENEVVEKMAIRRLKPKENKRIPI